MILRIDVNLPPPFFVQKSDPVHRYGDGAGVFFHLSLQDVGSGSVQHVAESIVYFGEENGFIDL